MSSSLKINWEASPRKKTVLYFDDLELNTPFRNISSKSQGAVYIKVALGMDSDEEYQYEVSSGKLWMPTASPVEVVPMELNVSAVKPYIYH